MDIVGVEKFVEHVKTHIGPTLVAQGFRFVSSQIRKRPVYSEDADMTVFEGRVFYEIRTSSDPLRITIEGLGHDWTRLDIAGVTVKAELEDTDAFLALPDWILSSKEDIDLLWMKPLGKVESFEAYKTGEFAEHMHRLNASPQSWEQSNYGVGMDASTASLYASEILLPELLGMLKAKGWIKDSSQDDEEDYYEADLFPESNMPDD